jgi:hypothetical protein
MKAKLRMNKATKTNFHMQAFYRMKKFKIFMKTKNNKG